MNEYTENIGGGLPSDELSAAQQSKPVELMKQPADPSPERQSQTHASAPSAQPFVQPAQPQYAPPRQQVRPQYATPPQFVQQPQYAQQGFARAPYPQGQAMQSNPQPQYYQNGASVAGFANAYPMYVYHKSPQETEREEIRTVSNVGGKLTIAIIITMVVVASVIAIIGFFTGIVLETPTLGEDPYMGFTPMGFYLYEGIISLVSIFIPSLIILCSVRKARGMRFDDFLPFKKLEGRKLAAVVFGGMAICMIAQVMAVMISVSFAVFGFDIDEAIDTPMGTQPLDIVMNTICTAIIPALVEEFAYRGVVLGVLKRYDTGLAIVGSAFLFGMLHGNLAQIPFAFVIGLVLAFVRVKTDSMLPNILIHFGNNFYAVILSTIEETAPENVATIVSLAVMAALMLVGFVCIYYLAKSDKDFFRLEKRQQTNLTTREKYKAFFTSGTVIASTIILCIETVTMLEFT